MTRYVITDPSEIADVLASPSLTPPPRHGAGATLALRNAMARFARPDDHPTRRAAVVEAAASVDPAVVAEVATGFAGAYLDHSRAVDAIAVARTVSVLALATGLELIDPSDGATADALVDDIDSVVAVIGRGEPPTPDSDAATERLLAIAADHPSRAVPVVSLLYQSYDATSALIATTMHADATGRQRCASVPRTTRVALADATVAGHGARLGDELVLEIGRAGIEFGSGPHACPGETIARALAESVVAAITASGYRVDLDSIALDGDGRPTSMSLDA